MQDFICCLKGCWSWKCVVWRGRTSSSTYIVLKCSENKLNIKFVAEWRNCGKQTRRSQICGRREYLFRICEKRRKAIENLGLRCKGVNDQWMPVFLWLNCKTLYSVANKCLTGGKLLYIFSFHVWLRSVSEQCCFGGKFWFHHQGQFVQRGECTSLCFEITREGVDNGMIVWVCVEGGVRISQDGPHNPTFLQWN
jgi:hypothetical protein